MSIKTVLARKGMGHVNAHNNRVLKTPQVKAARAAVIKARAARDAAIWATGEASLFTPEYDAASAALNAAESALSVTKADMSYVTLSDRVLIAVFNA
jgi:hypothetical protein